MILSYRTALERTLWLGKPSPEALRMWRANVAPHELDLSLIRPGATCSGITHDIDRFSADENPFEYRSSGHGRSLGMMSHHYDREAGLELREDVDTIMEPGMVVTMEPVLGNPPPYHSIRRREAATTSTTSSSWRGRCGEHRRLSPQAGGERDRLTIACETFACGRPLRHDRPRGRSTLLRAVLHPGSTTRGVELRTDMRGRGDDRRGSGAPAFLVLTDDTSGLVTAQHGHRDVHEDDVGGGRL